MKQTKKITRNQRNQLQKAGVDTENVRIVQETNAEIKFKKEGKAGIFTFNKGSGKVLSSVEIDY